MPLLDHDIDPAILDRQSLDHALAKLDVVKAHPRRFVPVVAGEALSIRSGGRYAGQFTCDDATRRNPADKTNIKTRSRSTIAQTRLA
jgi:hypothetical protein